jgi:hypothetical protein
VAALGFFGFFNVYALRVNLSVAIVAMTARKNVTLTNGTTIPVSLCSKLPSFGDLQGKVSQGKQPCAQSHFTV